MILSPLLIPLLIVLVILGFVCYIVLMAFKNYKESRYGAIWTDSSDTIPVNISNSMSLLADNDLMDNRRTRSSESIDDFHLYDGRSLLFDDD